VESAFGIDIDYAMLIKLYGPSEDPERRYSPAECIGIEKKPITGAPVAEDIKRGPHKKRATEISN